MRPRPTPSPTEARRREHRPYPFWARVTAALWLLVLGILVGGAAIPHAQDTPRVVPQGEDARFCRVPGETPAGPATRPVDADAGGTLERQDDVASRGYNRAP